MGCLKLLDSIKLVTCLFLPTVAIFAVLSPNLLAQLASEWKVSIKFPPTEERGSHNITVGAGGRLYLFPREKPTLENEGEIQPDTEPTTEQGSCIDRTKTVLTSLMPTRNNLGTTVSSNPTLYWYIPKTTAKVAQFVLVDNQGKIVYTTKMLVSGTPGIVKLNLPPTVSLELDNNYKWQLSLICDPRDWQKDEWVQGFIKRVELNQDLKTKLENVTPLEQAKVYAEAKIWQETLTNVAELRNSNPAAWEELLNSVGLEAIAKQPFIKSAQ